MSSELLSRQEAFDYWDCRHKQQDELRSGGHIGIDQGGNEIFYAVRLGKLLELIGDRNSPPAPLFVLDAGCGKGYFSRALGRCGHAIDGIDASPAAIEQCRSAGGAARFAVSTLAAWSSAWLYDVVFSVDVMFHILDDEEWAASVCNLASLVRFGGKLIIADENNEHRRQLGNYIVHRASAEYIDLVGDVGFRLERWIPYAFRDNRIGYLSFIRNR